MTAPPPRRPWWKKKRTWAAMSLWLVAVYPYTVGPVQYAAQRDWLSPWAWDVVRVVYAPIDPLWATFPRLARWSGYEAHVRWWSRLADRHEAASD